MKTILSISFLLIYNFSICQTFEISKLHENQFKKCIKHLQKNPNDKIVIGNLENQISYLFVLFTDYIQTELSEKQKSWATSLTNFSLINEKIKFSKSVLLKSAIVDDISNKMFNIRQLIADSVYNYSTNLISYNERFKYMEANYLLTKLNAIYPDYKNIGNLILLTEQKGISNVCIKVINHSGIDITDKYSYIFFNLDSLNLTSKWTKYSLCDSNSTYYKIVFTITEINISPETLSYIKYLKINSSYNKHYSNFCLGETHKGVHRRKCEIHKPMPYFSSDTFNFVEKEITFKGIISYFNQPDNQIIASRPFLIRNIFNYKWDVKYGNILSLNPEIIPSDNEMIVSVFKHFRKVIEKENILASY